MNEPKDKMKFLMRLLRRMPYGLSNTNINNSVDCCMSLHEIKNIKFASDEPEGEERIFKIYTYLIGNLKGLFQTLVRIGFDSSC